MYVRVLYVCERVYCMCVCEREKERESILYVCVCVCEYVHCISVCEYVHCIYVCAIHQNAPSCGFRPKNVFSQH